MFYVLIFIPITELRSKWYYRLSEVLMILSVYYISYVGSKTIATSLETCMTYIYVIQENSNRVFMTYMYVTQEVKGLMTCRLPGTYRNVIIGRGITICTP